MVLALVSGCGKDNPAAAPSKSLFSVWTADDNTEILDLRNLSFGVGGVMAFGFQTGEVCACNIALGGSEAAGTAILSGCAYVSGGSGDPGCASLNLSFTFTNAAAALRLCSGGSCFNYH